ncbi:MAG: methyltransferase domain-containing protein [bacterium]|nr:methyltransferase domain-containing protein [bacterium]
MSDRVRAFFEEEAATFDAIYTGGKGRFAAWLDRVFRWDVSARFDETLAACGDVRGLEVLDIGCGSGRYAIALARRGASVTGVDNARAMLEIARRLADREGVADRCRFVEADILSFEPAGRFGTAVAVGFFDYTADPARYLARFAGMTGGRLIATFPRRWTWRAPVRKARLGLRGCPVYFYTRRRIRRLLARTGWRPERIARVGKLHFVVARREGAGGNG